MSMQDKIDDMRRRREAALQGGGADKLDKHRQAGKCENHAADQILAQVFPGASGTSGQESTSAAGEAGMLTPALWHSDKLQQLDDVAIGVTPVADKAAVLCLRRRVKAHAGRE